MSPDTKNMHMNLINVEQFFIYFGYVISGVFTENMSQGLEGIGSQFSLIIQYRIIWH